MPDYTRFGPTALILPKLERYKHDTYLDYLELSLNKHVIKTLIKLLKDKDIRQYIGRNFLYEIPGLGKYLFANEVKKIIPLINTKDLRSAKGCGGIRPQIINKDKKKKYVSPRAENCFLEESSLLENNIYFKKGFCRPPRPGNSFSRNNIC